MIHNSTVATVSTVATSTFETANRNLENFLYMHNARHINYYKNDDGYTVWVYPRTDAVMNIVKEFRSLVAAKSEGRMVC